MLTPLFNRVSTLRWSVGTAVTSLAPRPHHMLPQHYAANVRLWPFDMKQTAVQCNTVFCETS